MKARVWAAIRKARAESMEQGGESDPEYVARSAIKAMREPTPNMLRGAAGDPATVWRKMIDAALED